MLRKIALILFVATISVVSKAQTSFAYTVEINPISVPDLPGIHSYAYAQYEGKWLVIGGRRDGLHARQPFNAFPASSNNTEAFVIDVNTQQFWSASLSQLPQSIFEQLQATNTNFHQVGDTLYVIGGYAYSSSANDHITFPNLTTILVSETIDAIINQAPLSSNFKQLVDYNFAVTGGQLGMLDNTFYLVGGHQFDGNYNPMGNPTYVQTYSNQIRMFTVDNSGSQLSYDNYEVITDPVHLHRRDFNLLPQIFADGTNGFTISSGVFQINEDLPYLYPVNITADGHTPNTAFNQYLSNYHCAHAGFYDANENEMHNLFFGGMSQYYYQNGNLIQDDLVPFVNTVSRLSRDADGNLFEFQLPVQMPGLKGASAEFIPNTNLPILNSGIIILSEIVADTFVVGHVLGGISSNTLNPFSVNQTSTTSASPTIYEIKFIRETATGVQLIDGKNPYDFNVFPNPAEETIHVTYGMEVPGKVNYFVSTLDGKIIAQGAFAEAGIGTINQDISLSKYASGEFLLTLVFEDKFFVTKRVFKE
jgi:hypothetical protein